MSAGQKRGEDIVHYEINKTERRRERGGGGGGGRDKEKGRQRETV